MILTDMDLLHITKEKIHASFKTEKTSIIPGRMAKKPIEDDFIIIRNPTAPRISGSSLIWMGKFSDFLNGSAALLHNFQ